MLDLEHTDSLPSTTNIPEQTASYELPPEYLRVGTVDGYENSFSDAEIAVARSRAKRAAATAGLSLLALTGSAAVGVVGCTTRSTDITIGPLHAEAQVTFDSQITATGMVDTPKGPRETSLSNPVYIPLRFGELELPSFLGAQVEVTDKLPFRFTKQGNIELTEISRSELEAYTTLFASYREDVKEAQERLRNTFLLYAGIGGAAIAGGWATTELLKRWQPLSTPSVRAVRIGLAGVLLASGCTPVVSAQAQTAPQPNVGMYFGAYPTQELSVNGILQTYLVESANFRDSAVDGVKKALDGLKLITDPDDEVLIQVIDGTKCSETGVSVSEAIADTVEPDIIEVVGDSALGGVDAIDKHCTENQLERLDGHTVHFQAGGHDFNEPAEYFKKTKIIHLEQGQIAEVEGLRLAGADDPEQHRTLTRTSEQVGSLSRSQVSSLLADLALSKGPLDGLSVNQPSMAQDWFDLGLPGLIFTGGFENKLLCHNGPYGTSYQFQVASAGGAVFHDEQGLDTIGRFLNPGYNGLIVYSKRLRAPVRAFVSETGTDTKSQLVYIPTQCQ